MDVNEEPGDIKDDKTYKIIRKSIESRLLSINVTWSQACDKIHE